MRLKRFTLILAVSITIIGCATYFQKNEKFQSTFYSGKFEAANKLLENNSKGETSRNRLLYFYDRGTTNFMLGKSVESNAYFEKADKYIEEYTTNYGAEALALATNPMMKPYKPEDFESVLIHFYKESSRLKASVFLPSTVQHRQIPLQSVGHIYLSIQK